MMKKMEDSVYSYIKENNLIEKEDNLVLAVSGGADSIFMLYVLYRINERYNLNLNMVVCHLNHMIRSEAIIDLEYVRKCATELGLQFFSKTVNIVSKVLLEKKSEEEIGRDERYKFFNEIGIENYGVDNYKICVAHNLNDNSETIFLNLIRGTGIDGLKGIDVVNNNVIRPILNVSRKNIEEYLEAKKLSYIIDETNLDTKYTRNSIRNELIPFVKERYNENIDNTLYKMSGIFRDKDLFLQKMTIKTLEDILISEDIEKNDEREVKEEIAEKIEDKLGNMIDHKVKLVLDLKLFNELDIVLKRRVLRYILKEYFITYKDISKTNIDDAIKIAYNNIGNKYIMLNKNIKFSILRGEILINN